MDDSLSDRIDDGGAMTTGAQLMDDEESTLVDLRPNPAFRSSPDLARAADQERAFESKRSEWSRKRKQTPTTLRGEAYFRHDAAAKQEALWDAIAKTAYRVLPSLTPKASPAFSTRVRQFFNEGYWPNAPEEQDDVSGAPVVPAYHRLGASALAEFRPNPKHPFTGLLARHCLLVLRVSLAVEPEKAFVPGLQVKFLIDGRPSVNVSAMHDLSGEPEHNVFGSQLSNVLVRPRRWSTRMAVAMRSNKLMEQPIEQIFSICSDGTEVRHVESGQQLLFCPTDLARSRMRGVRDFRRELPRILPGSPLFEVYVVSERLAEPALVGVVELTSSFISSEFQDTRLQFGSPR